jgi:alkylation response protein AidB-like acyl-CoA dehydrogenase
LSPLLARAAAAGPAVRAELAALTARYEAARGYLLDTARRAGPGASSTYLARVERTKTHVARECVALAGTLFALGGGSALSANGLAAKFARDVFVGTGLRPPLRGVLETWGNGLEAWTADVDEPPAPSSQ